MAIVSHDDGDANTESSSRAIKHVPSMTPMARISNQSVAATPDAVGESRDRDCLGDEEHTDRARRPCARLWCGRGAVHVGGTGGAWEPGHATSLESSGARFDGHRAEASLARPACGGDSDDDDAHACDPRRDLDDTGRRDGFLGDKVCAEAGLRVVEGGTPSRWPPLTP